MAEQTTESEYVAVVELQRKHYSRLLELREFLTKKIKRAVLLRVEWKDGVLFDTDTLLAEDAGDKYSQPKAEILHWREKTPLDPLVYPRGSTDVETPIRGTIHSRFVDVRDDGFSFRFRIDVGDACEELVDTYTVTWKMLQKLFR